MKTKTIILTIAASLCGYGVIAQHGSSGYIFADDIRNEYKGQTYVVFPEVREKSIQWFDSLRTEWIDQSRSTKEYRFKAQPGEYYTYQLGVWALDSLKDVRVEFSDLNAGKGKKIPVSEMTCFNLEGTDLHGEYFTKKLGVKAGRIHPLWIGVNLENAEPGEYKGKVKVKANGKTRTIPLSVTVTGEKVKNHGYDEGKRMARMNWLNNTIALDDEITKPFTPLKRSGNSIELLGRKFEIGPDGLPSSIATYFDHSVQSIGGKGEQILKSPFNFVIETLDGEQIRLTPGEIRFEKETEAGISWTVTNTSPEVDVTCRAVFEYEGFADYKVEVKAKQQLDIKDIRLEIPMEKDKAEYMMGLHYEGGKRPTETYNWRWDVSRNQDMLWIGDVNGGIRIKWKAENYVRPLINIYYKFGPLNLPSSWGNKCAGGVAVKEESDHVTVNAYSGRRFMHTGDILNYDFELLITPFRSVDKTVKYGDRYFHGGGTDESTKVAQAEKVGANIINIHHASDLYPFINYPYLDENLNDLNGIIKDAHNNNKRMKFYYTTRELTKNTPEFWAFYFLDGEILYPGPGNESRTYHLHRNGPAEWLKVNLREKYVPAWYNNIDRGIFKGEVDLSVVTTPDSRLNNFYIGGLDWMVRNMELDGVYIDDSALDRITLRRARKVIDRSRKDGRMDLHSCNHYDPHFGYSSCLNMYMELLPYFDLCWIGEGRDYNRMPDHWLIEVSGIPFGLPGQMLQGGGNPWRGMVYGITNRAGWGGDPTHIWNFWDTYKIQDKEMIGYWDRNSPLDTGNDFVKATLYKGDKESIISVAAWGETDQTCSIDIDWKKLGYDPNNVSFVMPEVEKFQEEKQLGSLKSIEIPKGKGFLIVVKNK